VFISVSEQTRGEICPNIPNKMSGRSRP
jgi:hypothetical protein